jgi:lipid A disaccharide synthetase
MGIRDEWILTPGSSASEIRRAFQVFSQSAMHVAQGGQVLSLPAP